MIAFRVASSRADGAGHVRRCLALARALGVPSRLFLDRGSPWILPLRREGLDVDDECASETGCDAVRAAAADARVRAVVLDGYRFEPRDRQGLAACTRLIEILDAPSRPVGALVVAPGLGLSEGDFPVEGRSTHVLAGARYALLDPLTYPAAHARGESGRPARRTSRILVSFGAVDSPNATRSVLQALERLTDRPAATVVLGRDAPHLDEVRSRAAGMADVEVLVDVEDMAALYERCDWAVGGGGVSLLERLCCGVPSLLMTLADNQVPNARAAEEMGLARYIGGVGEASIAAIAAAISRFQQDQAARGAMRQAGLAVVDGRGAERTARAIEELTVAA